MFYFIRLDCERPDGPSYSDLRETWHRTVEAMRGTSGPETIQSFKVVGRRTVFALIECDDTIALDDALAELSIVEDLGGAVELEVMPLRTYDGSEATAAPPEEPAVVAGESAVQGDLREETAEPEATTVPAEDALVTDEIRSLYEKPGGPEERTTEVQAPPEAEPEGLIPEEIDDSEAGEPPGQDIGTGEESGGAPEREQPEGLAAGLIENFDGLDEAPIEPAAVGDPAEQEAFPEETGEIESPEDSPITDLSRSSDSPGREFSVAEEPVEQGPDVDRPARLETSPTQPENPSVTGMIRNLDSPGHAREEAARPEAEDEAPRHTPTEPASPAWLEKDPGAIQDFEAAPEQPEGSGSVPGIIRSLDSPGHVPEASHEDPVSAKPKAPPSGPRVLLRFAGKLSGEVHEINQTGATMGRSFDNSIRLDDEMLSRRHALIEFRDGDFWLSDLGSSNGTFVNDTRLNAPHKLQSWDVIELGSTRLDVTLEGPAI